MTDDDRAALKAQLTSHEARRADVYDDATGKRITKGSFVAGHPTWGIGFNLDVMPICDAAIDAQYEHVLSAILAELTAALPWAVSLPSGPLRAILDVAWNTGIDGLLGFHKMLGFAQQGNFGAASLELIQSQLEPHRAARLAVLMRS